MKKILMTLLIFLIFIFFSWYVDIDAGSIVANGSGRDYFVHRHLFYDEYEFFVRKDENGYTPENIPNDICIKLDRILMSIVSIGVCTFSIVDLSKKTRKKV